MVDDLHYSARLAFNSAQEFQAASEFLWERWVATGPSKASAPMISAVAANGAFAAELYLKCLLLLNGRMTKGHNLKTLHSRLPEKDQIGIAACYIEGGPGAQHSFEGALWVCAEAYETWRYAFEWYDDPSDPMGDVQAAWSAKVPRAIETWLLEHYRDRVG